MKMSILGLAALAAAWSHGRDGRPSGRAAGADEDDDVGFPPL
jgi:hypothetical protein